MRSARSGHKGDLLLAQVAQRLQGGVRKEDKDRWGCASLWTISAPAVVPLGHRPGLSVIAQGVETQDQRHCLAQMRCYAYQGYLFSRPLPVQAFDAFTDKGGGQAPPSTQQPSFAASWRLVW